MSVAVLPSYLRFCWLLLVVFLSACSKQPDTVSIAQNGVILAYGDSLTQGVGADKSQSYPAHLAQALGVKVINQGISGETSAEGLARLEGILQAERPDLVILTHGGNDLLKKLPVAKLKANLQSMIALCQTYQAQVVLVGVPKPALMLSPLPVYEELAEQYELVAELDILSDLLGENAMKSDAVHLNGAGYKAFADALAEKITVY